MRRTISDLNKTIEIMRKAYPFKDDKTQITLERDMRSMIRDKVTLYTVDEETNTGVTLERNLEEESLKQ